MNDMLESPFGMLLVAAIGLAVCAVVVGIVKKSQNVSTGAAMAAALLALKVGENPLLADKIDFAVVGCAMAAAFGLLLVGLLSKSEKGQELENGR
ncbi:MAG: hypothetical protein R3C58_00555 [Parvularculaceae bacterium]